jgi:hypothetical protein
MDRSIDHIVAFRLAPAGLGFGMDVRLRRTGERWVAVVELASDASSTAGRRDRRASRAAGAGGGSGGFGGEEQTAVGPSPRAALTAALAHLDASAVKALLADTALLEPSVEIAALATG